MKTGNCKFGAGCRWHHPPELQQDGGKASMMKMGMAAGGTGAGVPNPMANGANPMANPMAMMDPMAMMGALMGAMAPAAAPPRPPAPAPEWETHYSDTGRPYYFNLRTSVSVWDQPPEMLMQQMGMMMGGLAPVLAPGPASLNPVRKFAGTNQGLNLPRRAGAARCSFFLKNGSCRFGDSCRYDHPPEDGGTDPTGDGHFSR